MPSIILRIAARTLTPTLFVAALILLFRGHNAPGGGFIGGLLAAAAVTLYAMANGPSSARQLIRVTPRTLMAIGLGIAFLSGVPSLFLELPYMSGQWVTLRLPFVDALPIGTALVFDIGIFIAVIGFVLTIFFALTEAEEEEVR
ncbi:MAG: Na+/H+ antiporter subunit B [Bacteroidetes bacterium]|nr:Na+/H+ antiporter subunit B [Bacteroidota bacterium]